MMKTVPASAHTQRGFSVNSASVVLALCGTLAVGAMPGLPDFGSSESDASCQRPHRVVMTAQQRMQTLEQDLQRMENGQDSRGCER